MAWLVGAEATANVFSFMTTSSSIPFFLSDPTSSAPGLLGQLVILLNPPMETLCHSIPVLYCGTEIMFVPLPLPTPKGISI